MSQSTRLSTLILAAAILFLGFFSPPPACADTPGLHPQYLRAISNLQASADLLSRQDELNVMRDQNNALNEINNAMRELRRALRVDERFVGERQFIPAIATRGGRLQRAMETLQAARSCVAREEDNRHALRDRNDAIGHIDRAMQFIGQAMRDEHRDDNHASHHNGYHH